MATYTRLFSDQPGESHFEEVEIALSWVDYAPPAPVLELSPITPAKQFGFMKAPAGWSSNLHPSSGRNLFFVLSGQWELSASDGQIRLFVSGDVLLAEDTTGKGHSSRVVGGTDSLIAMIQLEQ